MAYDERIAALERREHNLETRIAELEAALRPFAAYANRIDDGRDSQGYPDACPLALAPGADSAKQIVNLGHCRAARDMLGS